MEIYLLSAVTSVRKKILQQRPQMLQLLDYYNLSLGPYVKQATREYVITGLMKLSSRLSDSGAQNKVKELLNQYTDSKEIEIQQRVVEYTNLFSHDSILPAVLERMPVPKPRIVIRNSSNLDNSYSTYSTSTSKSKGPTDQGLLLDLMGIDTSGSDSGFGDSSVSAAKSF